MRQGDSSQLGTMARHHQLHQKHSSLSRVARATSDASLATMTAVRSRRRRRHRVVEMRLSSIPRSVVAVSSVEDSDCHQMTTSAQAVSHTRHQAVPRPPSSIFFAFLLLLLLVHAPSSILCLDSFNDLEEIQSSLCETVGTNALGMESGTVVDSALSASSSYNEQSVGPQNARLNRELNGGAWCPSTQLNSKNSGQEWIQVNLSEPYVITKVATQGRFGNGMGVEFAEYFWLDYTRDGDNWIRWRNQFGEYEIQGNVDTYSIVESVLPIPLVGVIAVRLLPISQHTRTCCVRFELYGCPYKDGPIAYSMMDGQYNGRFGDLIDDTYDGIRQENGYLSGGLGQLVDGIRGEDNYKVNKGFEWIGWRATGHSLLSITFQFAEMRNFTFASFHCNNLFTKDMQVFHSAKIWFSQDGRQWASVPEDFEYMPDMVMEKARDVVIHLHHRVGRFVKFDLRFAAKWLLISEVRFDSRPVNRALLINEPDLFGLGLATDLTQTGPITTTPLSPTRSLFQEPFVLVIFGAVIVLLLVFLALLLLLARKRKEKITGTEYMTVPMKDVAATPLYCEPHDYNRLSPYAINGDPEYAVPDVVGNGATTYLHINGAKQNGTPLSFARPTNQVLTFTTTANGKEDDGKARYYASTDVLGRGAPLTEQFYPMSHHNTVSDHFFATNKINPLVSHTPPPHFPPPTSSTNTPLHISPPSSLSSNSSRVLKQANSPGNSAYDGYENTQIHSSATKTPSPGATSQHGPQIPQLKDSEVSVIDGHFGYSKYGDCELGYFLRANEKKLVILKTLSGNEQFRDEFITEMNEKWRLSNKCSETFARLHGYITKYDYMAMVIEYGDVDLKQFLRSASPSTVGLADLMEIAGQVAEAMQHLHLRGFIHRDLAARNCLIYTDSLKVKITDSGAFIKEYKNEYYNEVLPIRWMSYQSLLKGEFTNKSDVYSFGVTLWEILKYCKILPHQHLRDEEILGEIFNDNHLVNENSDNSAFYKHPFHEANSTNSSTTLQLSRPKDCPDEVYDIILECTQRNEAKRPEFNEIVYFLKKKCLSLRKA